MSAKDSGIWRSSNLSAMSIGCNGPFVLSKLCTWLGRFQTDASAARLFEGALLLCRSACMWKREWVFAGPGWGCFRSGS